MVASGAGTDHLPAGKTFTLQDVTDAYLEQCEAIESVDGRIILMASRALAAVARDADDYASVYASVLSQVRQPVILHWLGPMFDPALEGYWGGNTVSAATENCLSIIRANKEKVDGIKISLLDADLEVSMRRRLPPGVRMYTGDDFNYDRLILGDAQGHSDALLGQLRRDCSSRVAGVGCTRCRGNFTLSGVAGAHRAAFPSYLRVANAAL